MNEQELTLGEIEEAFMATLGYPPRSADLALFGSGLLGRDLESVAEYIWDHHMGEPPIPISDVVRTIRLEVGK